MNSSDDSIEIRNSDEQHLNLLAIFHYVLAGIGALIACFPLIHVTLGVVMVTNPQFFGDTQNPPPPEIGYIFIAIGGTMVLMGWAMALVTFISGRKIARRQSRTFSVVVAAILCLFMPFGTILGVFTIIVLSKKSVQELYAEA